jgi:DNA helicase-2/ATP-dependent DNA helicase PcrA
VALTRARRRLYLTFAQSRMLHGQVNYGMASSFLRELPQELLHWLTPAYGSQQLSREPQEVFAAAPARSVARGSAPETAMPWRPGQRVFHQKFGEGTVLEVKGGGAEGQVQVKFKHAGTKWLALEYAKLTPV